jgi:hypothetical protein
MNGKRLSDILHLDAGQLTQSYCSRFELVRVLIETSGAGIRHFYTPD